MDNTDRRFARLVERLTQILVWEFNSLRATPEDSLPIVRNDPPKTSAPRRPNVQKQRKSRSK